jgi:hypothetical protein
VVPRWILILLSGAELPSTNTVSGSEVILWRYEISYCTCGHKVLSDIVGLRDSTPVFLSGLNPLYFCTDDAEEAFPICIKTPDPEFPVVATSLIAVRYLGARSTGSKDGAIT